ncbi:MAG: hypothetical protein ACRCX2_10875 [Paraclostridium sp.]
MMNNNFLIGLATVVVGIVLACIFLIGGFALIGPAFMFVLFAIFALVAIIAINYDGIEELGENVNRYMEEKRHD